MKHAPFPQHLIQSAIESMPAACMLLSPQGTVDWANAATASVLDLREGDEVLGRHIREFFPSEERSAIDRCLATLSSSPSTLICRVGGETDRRLHMHLSSFHEDSRTHMLAIVCEAERNRPVQAELRHAQKLEVVGQLAGGIAHDFNNLITAIFGYLEIARRSLPPDHQAQSAIEGVREAAEQAAGVTRTLLTFTRKSTPERSIVNLKDLVLQSAKLLRRAMPSSIQLITPADSTAGAVWLEADANQIQQVILNLALNARDALQRGGTIRLSAEYENDPQAKGQTRAVLIVSDTGGGITPEVLPRIFEPFFTTKSDSGHSGLGLAIIQEIIRTHGGRIDLKTGVGEGTTFRVSFPSAPQDSSTKPAKPETAPPAHGETLLIVEDDALVRQIIASQLRQFGYSVMEAGAAQIAASIAQQNRSVISLVICDLELPDMPGDKLVSRLRADGIHVPVILITGSIQFDPGPLEADGVTLLRKPFGVARLADTVSKVLSIAAASKEAAPGSEST